MLPPMQSVQMIMISRLWMITDCQTPPISHTPLHAWLWWLAARCKHLLRASMRAMLSQLLIFLEAGRRLARAVSHGQEQGYADVRGTGQTIHRAKVFGYMLETRSRLRCAMAALRLPHARFA